MSESHKGQKRSEEAKEHMRIAQRKRADSDEEKNIRSEIAKKDRIAYFFVILVGFVCFCNNKYNFFFKMTNFYEFNN